MLWELKSRGVEEQVSVLHTEVMAGLNEKKRLGKKLLKEERKLVEQTSEKRKVDLL